MKSAVFPDNEALRLSELKRYKILDTASEEIFDDIASIASHICGTPIALITLLDEKRQWFKAAVGLGVNETSREISFCGHAILGDILFEVPDALEDIRFHDNPLVTGPPNIRFYAGMPLMTPEGFALGTLCVIDQTPRILNNEQRSALQKLGRQVVSQIRYRLDALETAVLNESLADKSTFYDTLLKSADLSIISTRPDGVITSFNMGAEKMLGYRAADMIGTHTPSVLHDEQEVIDRAAELSLSLGRDIKPGFQVFVINATHGQSDTHEWTYIRKDGTKFPVSLTVTAMHDNTGGLIGYLGIARDITQSRHAKRSLAQLTGILQRTGEMAKVGGWELDLLTMQLQWSKEVYSIYEVELPYTPELDQAITFFSREARPIIIAAVAASIENGTPWDLELPFVTAQGNHRWVRAQGSAIMHQGKAVSLIGAIQDITERKKNELDLAWVNRALQMLGKCNETLIHMTDETALITEICRIAVVIGGYRMAWVGYAEDDEYKSVLPKAHFGHANDFLDQIKLSWSDSHVNGLGPGGRTIRNGQTIVVEDLLLDASYPVKKQALDQGYRAMLSLPLKNKQNTFGLLALYLGEAHSFAQDELRLLQDLADNLAAGIINIRAENERNQLHSAMLKVATAVSVASGESFFSQLVSNMVSALGAQAGYVAQLIDEVPLKGRTTAVIVDDKIIDNFEFPIPDTLADALFGSKDLRIVPKHAARNFPNLSMMRFFKYQAFAGLCLYNSAGEAIGLLFVFYREPLLKKSNDLITSTLKIFAARTVSELERQASAIAIAENARFIKTVTDAMPAMVAYWDRDLRCRFANRSYLQWFGKPPEAIIGTTIQSLLGERLFNMNEPYIRGALAGECQQFERTLIRADGSSGYTWANYIPDIDAEGTVNGFFVLVTDVSPIKKAESDLRLAASVFKNTIEGIMVTDIEGTIVSVNPAFTKITGYSPEEAIGETPRLLKSDRHDPAFYADMWDSIRGPGLWHGEVWNRIKSGEIHPDLMTITAVADTDEKVTNYVAIFTDNTAYKMQEQQRLAEESLQRDALVREVHHRIKNNLQSVASLLGNFSAEHPELSEPINSAINQVKSIAVIHGLQGHYVHSAVRLKDLVSAIAENNKSLWNTSISVNIQSDWLPTLIAEKEAVPLALVLNELILNAVKHGDKSKGVSVSLTQDASLNKASVIISNSGQLSPNQSTDTPDFGTGLQLVTTLLPKKNASLSWEQSGNMVLTRIELLSPIISLESGK